MKMVIKNINGISKGLISGLLVCTIIFILFLVITIKNLYAQAEAQTTNTTIMNASIVQVIGMVFSPFLAEGVLFTNTTTIGTQHPITDMTAWNNATRNYNGTPPHYNTTLYHINASSANKVNITICHCACDHLRNGTSLTLILNITGVAWSNSTFNNATHPSFSSLFNFTGPDSFQVVAGNLNAGMTIFLRYWIDPTPDTAPSGNYNTTYLFKAVEVGQSCGICNC